MSRRPHITLPARPTRPVRTGRDYVGIEISEDKFYFHPNGRTYIRIKIKGAKSKDIPLARIVMENHLKRKLLSSELVHHKNENSSDDRIENLEIITRSEHQQLHNPAKGRITSEETKNRLRIANLGKKQTDETKLKKSIATKGRIKTEEHKRKIGDGNRGKIRSEETKRKISETLLKINRGAAI
jgi:HNH endonuclease/NUMOD3 motif